MPVSIDILIKRDNGTEISCFKSLRIRTGMLLGPEDLQSEKELITLTTSSGVVGVKKIRVWVTVTEKIDKVSVGRRNFGPNGFRNRTEVVVKMISNNIWL